MVTVLAVFVMTWFCVENEDKKENGVSSGVTAFGDKVVSDGVRSVQVDENADCDKAYVTVVDLKDGGGSRIYGKGAQAALSGVHIDRAGTYILSGELTDGQIYVNAEEGVDLVLNGVKIKSSKGAALVATGGETRLILKENSENYLSDADSYANGEFTDGCVYAEKSLVIGGKGKLFINGNYADGISCGEHLVIESGEVRVVAVRNALYGKNAVLLNGGNVLLGA